MKMRTVKMKKEGNGSEPQTVLIYTKILMFCQAFFQYSVQLCKRCYFKGKAEFRHGSMCIFYK